MIWLIPWVPLGTRSALLGALGEPLGSIGVFAATHSTCDDGRGTHTITGVRAPPRNHLAKTPILLGELLQALAGLLVTRRWAFFAPLPSQGVVWRPWGALGQYWGALGPPHIQHANVR